MVIGFMLEGGKLKKLWFGELEFKESLILSLHTFYSLLIVFLSFSNFFKCALFSKGKSKLFSMTCKSGASLFPYPWLTTSCLRSLSSVVSDITVTHASGIFHLFSHAIALLLPSLRMLSLPCHLKNSDQSHDPTKVLLLC